MPTSDQSSTEHTRNIILQMEQALGANSNDMARYFDDDFRWMGNQGCGTKNGLAAFRRNWQLPLRAAFTEREYCTEKLICEGDWAACFGHIEATHSGAFMGIEPTGKRINIPYMDFWKIRDGKIADNWVSVDFAHVLAQLGKDVFQGEGWENYDMGRKTPAQPEQDMK